MSVPVDQLARDRIRTSIEESLFIEAGAGTGKTRSMIDRLVYLVDSGVDLRNIAAITFTEAAAAELKDRLRQEAEAQAASAEPGTPAHDRWSRALDQLDGAAIQTLHAFAQRILASHPLEAGLPPGFQAMDATQSSLAFDDRWRRFLDEFLGEDGPWDVVEAIAAFTPNFDNLRELAVTLSGNWDRLEPLPPGPGPRPALQLDVVIQPLELLESCRGQHLKEGDKLAAELEQVVPLLETIRNAPNLRALFRALGSNGPGLKSGRKENWPTGMLEDARQAIRDYRESRDELRAELADWCSRAVMYHLAVFARDYATERRLQGRLDFHDLLTLARNLLRDDDHARRAVHERYTHVLIDEFQDTDPLQIEIASLVVRPSDCPGDVPWYRAPVPPGSLVVVGDPKQSIYRFRRADIQLYLQAGTLLGAERVELTQNWRSVPSVLDWVNHVFHDLIGPDADPDAGQPGYVSLVPGRTATGNTPHIHWFGEQHNNVEAARQAEADDIARSVLKVRDEAWPVPADGAEGARGARLADIAILFPRRTVLPHLEQSFEEYGIPYRVESRSLLYETQDVVDLVNILAALADQTDQVAIVAALRSPAFACSDRDLAGWQALGGKWDYTLPAPAGIAAGHPVAAAMEWLHEMHHEAARHPVNQVVERVIRERHVMELAFAYRRPREHWQRYRFVLEQARAFTAEQAGSLRSFVQWMRRQAEERVDVAESAVPEPDDDAVRLLTVHASKGLQFPVVVLAGLSNTGKGRRSPLLWDDGGVPHVKLGNIKCMGYDEAHETDAGREAAESQRLLYVAATRARDHLLVGLARGTRGESHASRLAAYTDAGHLWQELDLSGERPPLSAHDTGATLPAESRGAWGERRAQVIAERTAGRTVAATTIARRLHAEAAPVDAEAETDEVRPWKRGRAGTSVGRAVHAVLQTVDFDTHEGLEEAAHVQAVAEGVPGREREVARLAAAALSSEAVEAARTSGRYWRELFVSTPIGGQLVEGFIDLLYETPAGLVVVDYKTDVLRSDAEVEDAAARYRLQAAAYAVALENQLGREVAACTFVFLAEGGSRERTVADLPAAKPEIEDALLSAR